VRKSTLHLRSTLLTGKSEARPDGTTAGAAGPLAKTDVKIDPDAKMPVSSGKKSDEMRKISLVTVTATPACNGATEIIIGPVRDHDPRAPVHRDEMTVNTSAGEKRVIGEGARREKRKRRRRQRPRSPRSP